MTDNAGPPPSHDLETSATVQDVTLDGVHTAEAQNAAAFIHTTLPRKSSFTSFVSTIPRLDPISKLPMFAVIGEI